MKLLVVSSWFPHPPDNGAKLRIFNLLAQLAKRHEITLLSFAERHEERGIAGLRDMCRSVQTVPGNPFKPARLKARDLFSPMPRSYVQTYSAEMQTRVDRELPGYDAAIASQLGAAVYLADRASLPRVFEEAEVGAIRDQYIKQPQGPVRWRRGLMWWKYRRFVSRLVQRFEQTTVVSDVERQHLLEAGCRPESVRLVPNGVAREMRDIVGHSISGQLIYPGAVTYSANLEAVRFFTGEIWPIVRTVRPDASFVVSGATGDVDITSLRAERGVTFSGCVLNIGRLVADSAVCVVPLQSGGGTRLKILEAMAVGTPVVSTTKGAEGLQVVHNEHLLIADSPAAFAREVVRLIENPALGARLAVNARRVIDAHYTWDRIGDALETALHEACAAYRPAAVGRAVGRSVAARTARVRG